MLKIRFVTLFLNLNMIWFWEDDKWKKKFTTTLNPNDYKIDFLK